MAWALEFKFPTVVGLKLLPVLEPANDHEARFEGWNLSSAIPFK